MMAKQETVHCCSKAACFSIGHQQIVGLIPTKIYDKYRCGRASTPAQVTVVRIWALRNWLQTATQMEDQLQYLRSVQVPVKKGLMFEYMPRRCEIVCTTSTCHSITYCMSFESVASVVKGTSSLGQWTLG